jgi:hypothetical protein
MLHHPSKQIMPLFARNILPTISLLKKQNTINTPGRQFFFVKTNKLQQTMLDQLNKLKILRLLKFPL